jgi:glycosyltransferase involved in cell wall biosynthesis
MLMPKISICIPTWESYGYSEVFTIDLFESIKKQTFNDYQVCISDHSQNDVVLDLCQEYANYFEIKYFKNSNNIGNGPSNTNSAMEMADGEIIKIMFQDDFFFSENALMIINSVFSDTNAKWLVNGCNHFQQNVYYNEMIPKWNEKIIKGINTISSPSVLSIKKEVKEIFDENLKMMMDCEYYYNLYCKYGEPKIIDEVLVTNRVHQNQISSLYVNDNDYKEKFNLEIDYCLKKYNLV